MIDAEIDSRLTNWARVYRDKSRSHTTMLARMIALYGAQDEDARRDRDERDALPADERDAALVERALCSPIYPERYRLMLCAMYLRPDISVGRLRKAMGLHSRSFESETRRACAILRNVLDFYGKDHP